MSPLVIGIIIAVVLVIVVVVVVISSSSSTSTSSDIAPTATTSPAAPAPSSTPAAPVNVNEKVCVGLIGKYPMKPRVTWNGPDGKPTYPVALRTSTFTPLNCDQYYQGTTGNPINGPVSIDQMCDAIKQTYPKQSTMPSSILAAYNDSCSSSSTYQVPQYIRYNNLYRIMTSRLNLQP